jgi:hypothetical protein
MEVVRSRGESLSQRARHLVQQAAIRAEDGLNLVWPLPGADELRLLNAVRPYTMVGPARLRTLYRLARKVDGSQVPGSFVECGTCNGGSGAILAARAAQTGRHVWLFDSFAGLPAPDPEDGGEAIGWEGGCLGDEASVREVLAKVGARAEQVHIVKGWFEDTLATSTTGTIALLHLDGDWYASTRTILDAFYDRIHPGGFLVVDDYGHWQGCRRAVDEFFAARRLRPSVVRSDYTGVWFAKPTVDSGQLAT